MVTGYNTDVRYGDIVLHVQTEDKGIDNPFIESLVYHRGQVVVAKRASYADLLQEGKGEHEIMPLMDHQHRMMIKAIKTGKFDDKIRPFLPPSEVHETDPSTAPLDLAEDTGKTLDQVILEYLTNEAEQEQLLLLMENEVELTAGSRSTMALRARSSRSGEPVSGVQISAKMISTAGAPRTLGAGETDVEGYLALAIDIPEVERGTAALIVTAASEIGQAEFKQLL